MKCYKSGGCGVYENRGCNECPASKLEYLERFHCQAPISTPTSASTISVRSTSDIITSHNKKSEYASKNPKDAIDDLSNLRGVPTQEIIRQLRVYGETNPYRGRGGEVCRVPKNILNLASDSLEDFMMAAKNKH